MSALLDHILHVFVERLVADGALALVPDATPELLVEDLRARLAEAPPFSSAGPFLANALMASPYVEELFATDTDIIEALNAVQS